MVEQHKHRLFRFRLFVSGGYIQIQAVLVLPVMPDDRALVLHLYGRGSEVFGFKNLLRFGERLRRLPSQFTYRRLCIGNPHKDPCLLVLLPDIDAGSRLDRTLGIVFTVNNPVLPIQFLYVLIFHVEHIAIASVPIKLADLSDTITANAQVHHKTENGKAHNPCKLLLQVFYQGRAQQTQGNKLGDQKNEQDRHISEYPVDRFLLDCFGKNDNADDFFQRDSECKADHNARKWRPAQTQRN